MEEKRVLLMQQTVVVVALAMIACTLWGSAYPCVKIGYKLFNIQSNDTAAQLMFAGMRFFLAGIEAVIFASVAGRSFVIPKKSAVSSIFLLCLFQTVGQYLFYYIALAHTSGVKASILNGTNAFFTILFAVYVFHTEKMTPYKLIGCIVGFTGLVLVNLNGSYGIDLDVTLFGEGFMLCASVSASISSVLLGIFSKKHNPVMLSGYQFIIGGLILFLVGVSMGGSLNFSTAGAILIIYMSLISSVAYSLWGILLKYNPVSRISIFSFTYNVIGVILSAVLLNEYSNLTIWCLIALVLVSAGVVIVNKGGKGGSSDSIQSA